MNQQRLRPLLFTLFLFCFCLGLGFRSAAETIVDGLIIQADTGERDLQAQTITLKGNVQIVVKDQHLRADLVKINQSKKELEAQGHVLLTTPKALIGGERMRLNYETNTGSIYTGFVQSGQVLFEGSLIEKKGDDEFLTVDSHYTSCTTCPAAWSFSGKSIDASLGGYAFIKNSILRFGPVPVFWLPYLIVPLKNDRQTGLLTPSFEYSERGGLSVSQPFFWALSESQDLTLTLQNYAIRGIKTKINHRYVLAKESDGELDSGYIRDSDFGQSDRYTNYALPAYRTNRWFFHYKHSWSLPQDWTFRAQINDASDLQYPIDFPFETQYNGEPAMDNRFSLTKNFDDLHLSVDNSYYVNLLHGDPLASNKESIHRLPEIDLSSVKQNLGESSFFFNYHLRYLNLYREGLAYDDLVQEVSSDGEVKRQVAHICSGHRIVYDSTWDQDPTCKPLRDGQFNSGQDLIRAGQRLQFEPMISRPTRLGGAFYFIPTLAYSETQYRFGINEIPDLSRRFLRAKMKVQTSFSRIFGDTSDTSDARYKHEIEPEIISTSVPWINQPQHPFFGFRNSTEVPFYSRETASDFDLNGENGIQFDYDDRLYERNLITYRITNKITKKTFNALSSPTYNRLATWRISQTYDVYEAQKGLDAKPWSDIESILSVRLPYFNSYSKINYFPYQKVTDTSSHITFNDDNGNYLRLGLTQKFSPSPDSKIDDSQRVEDYLLQVGTTARYVNFAGRIIYNGNNSDRLLDKTRIKALTYAIILRPPGDCWGIHFVQHRDVANNDVTYRLNFDFLFDGKVATTSPTKLLEGYGF